MELRNVECSVLLCEFTSFLIFLLVSSSYFSLYLLFFSFVQQELVVYHHAFSVGSCSKKTSQPTSVIRPSLVLSFLFLSVLVLGAEDIQKKMDWIQQLRLGRVYARPRAIDMANVSKC